jgi:hypothetical protein
MITTDMTTLSSDLAATIADFDAQISLTFGGALAKETADTNNLVARLVRRFVGQEANQRRLIELVQSLTVGVRDSEPHVDASGRTSQHPQVGQSHQNRLLPNVNTTEQAGQHPALLVAPLEVPDRITKRDYNYFDALNAALAALPSR